MLDGAQPDWDLMAQTAFYEDSKPFSFTGTVKKVVFDIAPHVATQDELDVHTAGQHGQAAHALSS